MLVKDRQTDRRTDSTITVYLDSSALGIMTNKQTNRQTNYRMPPPSA